MESVESIPAPPQPTSLPLPHPEAYAGEPREYARALMQRKDDIEKEIDALKDVLASHGATADTALVDPEGYPRGDIDVYAIRHARAALVRLYNDRTEVTRRLGEALESAFAAPAGGSESNAAPAPAPPAASSAPAPAANGHRDSSTATTMDDTPSAWPERPLARVNTVAPRSPAADSGLLPNDIIYSFSGITADTANGFSQIGSVVAGSQGQALTLLVLRGSERKMLRLTPRADWGGRGLLGCHILPM